MKSCQAILLSESLMRILQLTRIIELFKGQEEYWDSVPVALKNAVEAAAAAMSLRSCPTLCDPIDGSPPGSPIPGILQARTLEWAAISFSNA